MDGGAWWSTVHEVAEFDMTEQLSIHAQGVHLQAIDRQQVTKRPISFQFKPQRPCLPPPPYLALLFLFPQRLSHSNTLSVYLYVYCLCLQNKDSDSCLLHVF